MIAVVLGLQVALPLALLVWLAFAPLGSALGFALQSAGIAAFLFALARVAQWALPVWWLPWVYAALWMGIVGTNLFRAHFAGLPLLPAGLWGGREPGSRSSCSASAAGTAREPSPGRSCRMSKLSISPTLSARVPTLSGMAGRKRW